MYSIHGDFTHIPGFWQRLRHNYQTYHPYQFFTAPMRIEGARRAIEQNPPELRFQAKRIINSMVHPETGHVIPWYGRLSGFMVLNYPINLAMMYASKSLLIPIIWLNSTHTAILNFSNRNTTSSYTDKDIYWGYFGAVTVTAPLVIAIRSLSAPYINLIQYSMIRFICKNLTTWMAAGFAGLTNLAIVRRKEFKDGIAVFSPITGLYQGRSRYAGSLAVWQTGISRISIGLSMMIYPMIQFSLFKIPWVRQYPFPSSFLLLSLHGLSLWFWFIFSLSLYPRIGSVKSSHLQPEFRNLRDPRSNQHLDYLIFNKGL